MRISRITRNDPSDARTVKIVAYMIESVLYERLPWSGLRKICVAVSNTGVALSLKQTMKLIIGASSIAEIFRWSELIFMPTRLLLATVLTKFRLLVCHPTHTIYLAPAWFVLRAKPWERRMSIIAYYLRHYGIIVNLPSRVASNQLDG